MIDVKLSNFDGSHTVQVPEPWPAPYLFVLRDSTVYMNCTPSGDSRFWAIELADDDTRTQYRSTDAQFTDNGFYELPPVGMPTTPRLVINDTSRNNGTRIICSTSETTLFIFGKIAEFLLSNNNSCVHHRAYSI